MSRRIRLSLFAPLLLSLLAACGAAATPAPTIAPSPSPGPKASFEIKIAAPLSLTWTSVPGAVTSYCSTPATGSWSFRYTAAAELDTPYLDIQLVLPSGLATVNGSGDFRVDFSPGESTGLPVFMADPLGLLSGNHDTSGTISVSVAGAVARIVIDGVALGRGSTTNPSGLQAFTMDLTCPMES